MSEAPKERAVPLLGNWREERDLARAREEQKKRAGGKYVIETAVLFSHEHAEHHDVMHHE
ncbi:hypothetical protein KIPB_013800, partial [Kipferlia bialata]|eukprot:g13800.t1